MRVIVIGAGISGMNFFKFAEEQLRDVDVVCYEKNSDIGGTVSSRSLRFIMEICTVHLDLLFCLFYPMYFPILPHAADYLL